MVQAQSQGVVLPLGARVVLFRSFASGFAWVGWRGLLFLAPGGSFVPVALAPPLFGAGGLPSVAQPPLFGG